MILKALIPVRSGSLRVKDKNIRPFADSNLLEIKIQQMLRIQQLGLIDGVVINSNSNEMLSIAEKYNVEIVKRDEYFATNSISANKHYENIAQNIICDSIVLVHVTAPLLRDDSIVKCIQAYNNKFLTHDSVVSVSECKEFLWLNGKAINYDTQNKPRSQDLPNILKINHAINIISRELMLIKKDIISFNPQFITLDKRESIDIDDEVDFEIAEFLYKKWGGVDSIHKNLSP